MSIMRRYNKWFFLVILLMVIWSCRKKDLAPDTSSQLYFSTDTITFDTVFTTIGSSTEFFMIRNKSSRSINISSIKLAGGSNSNFRINIDGLSGVDFTDIEILPEDSLFAFVEVTVDPNNQNQPMLITDSIVFFTNGHIQDVDLVAFGQDAYFILPNKSISGLPPFNIVAGEGVDTTWTNEKPIVVYGYAVVDSTATLRIQEGTQIYFHANSGLWIYKGGSLKVNGSLNKEVVFQGDRREQSYENTPGQWDRIWLNEGSVDNEINYAIIKNGFIGIQSEILQEHMGNKLQINNSIIKNMSGAGILARNYIIASENLVIADCQQYALALTMGGLYDFKHATISNNWSYSIRNTPALYFNNYYKSSTNVVYPFDLVQANFTNCIIYGNNDEELVADSSNLGGKFQYFFDHCLIKSSMNVSDLNHWNQILVNQDPLFEDKSNFDFHLQTNSPARKVGKSGVVAVDIEGELRDVNTPNLGAYEVLPSN